MILIFYDNRNNYYGFKFWFLMRGENQSAQAKTFQSKVPENLKTQHIWVCCFFTHMTLRPGSKLGHIGGRQVFSPLCQTGAQCWHGSGFKETLLSWRKQWDLNQLSGRKKEISINDLSDGTVTVILGSKNSPENYTKS